MSKAIVFDMDGVLFDTEKLCMDSWCAIAKEQNIPDMEIVFPRCIGTNANDTETIVYEHYGREFDYDGFRKTASQWFWKYIEEEGIPVKPGVRELLDYLQKEGYEIGLASSTRYASIMKCLEKAEIQDYFSLVVSGDMVEHSKPNPEIFLLACERMGVKPEETYVIEDSYNGIRAAAAAGMKGIMVPDMLPANEEMEDLSLVILENLLQVRDFLAKQ